MGSDRTEPLDSRLLGHVLRPYREHCRYLHSAELVVPTDGSCEVRIDGRLSISESCYIDDTGHFNSVEFNLCYNQLVYALMAQCVISGVLDVFSGMTLEEYFDRQLPDILIHDFRSKFKRAMRTDDFGGTVEILDAKRRRNFVMVRTRVEFSDGLGGSSRGEIVLAIVDRADVDMEEPAEAPSASALEADFVAELRAATEAERAPRLTRRLGALLVEFLQFDADEEIGADEGFLDLGFDSLLAVDFKILLEERFGLELSSTALFDCPTPRALVELLMPMILAGPEPIPEAAAETPGTPSSPTPNRTEDEQPLGLSRDELLRLAQLRGERLREREAADAEPLAIVGMACRFPGGANDTQSFWRLAADGTDAIIEVPPDRWDIDEHYDPDPEATGKMYTRCGGFIDDVRGFDAGFFGISPREAEQMDPRGRLMLEVTWEAFENAAWSAEELQGSSTGVFIGALNSEYLESQGVRTPERAETYSATGTSSSTLAGRLSFTLGLTGPCFALDTACSSSLVALHQATSAIRNGECEAALVGAVNILIDAFANISVCKASMLAPDGRCKTFDASADGYVRSEGVAAIVIEPLSRALARGDRILGLVRGSAVNQDGASGGLTVPSSRAQEAVIRAALADGRLEPGDVDYIEAHGTGTVLGDPIEVSALDAVFGPPERRGRPLAIGSVKTNIGHTEPVAGLAGLIKVVQALRHEQLPAHLNFKHPSPHIPWERTVVEVVQEPRPWPRSERPRRAGINSFGFSGTNGHVVIEEAPLPAKRPASVERPEPIPLSADSPAALARVAQRLSAALEASPELRVADVARTLGPGRTQRSLRAGAVVADAAELSAFLRRVAEDPASSGVRRSAKEPRIAFLFTGQGSQLIGMGRDLYRLQPAFRASLERTAALLDSELEAPLTEVLWGDAAHLLGRTDHTQPCLFALQVALVDTWRAFGVEPEFVLGHSVGEIAAAWCAGVLSLEHAARLAAARGRLMVEHTTPGDMLEVLAEPSELQGLVDADSKRLGIAAINCEARVVLSGEPAAIAAAAERLKRQGLRSRALEVSHAFHSPLMEPMLEPFRAVLEGLDFHPPRLGFSSCLEPGCAPARLTDVEYWIEHVRRPVRFHEAMTRLVEAGPDALVEIGPAPVLLGLAKRFVEDDRIAFVPSQRTRSEDTEGDGWRQLGQAALDLFAKGVALDWRAVSAGSGGRPVELPAYPFDSTPHWVKPGRKGGLPADAHPLLGLQLDLASAPGGALFATELDPETPLVADHQVQGAVLVAAAAWVEAGLAAALRCGASQTAGIAELQISRARFVEPAGAEVQLVVTAGGGFEIFGRDKGADAFERHAGGRLLLDPPFESERLDLDALRAAAAESFDVDAYDASLRDLGLGYGPFYRRLEELHLAPDFALGRLRAPSAAEEEGPYVLHPGLLDAAFQTAGVLAARTGADALFLPTAIAELRVGAPRVRPVWVRTRLIEGSATADRLVLELDLLADDGTRVASVHGLQLARTAREALLAQTDPLRALGHGIRWQTVAVPTFDDAAAAGDWLLVGAQLGDLAQLLESAGARVQRFDSEQLGSHGPALSTWLGERLAACAEPRGIVHGLGLAAAGDDPPATVARELAVLRAALAAAAACERGNCTLLLATAGAQSTGDDGLHPDPARAALHGFAASAAFEHPQLGLVAFDQDPRAPDPEAQARALAAVLTSPPSNNPERRLAWRAGGLRAARLAALSVRDERTLGAPRFAAWSLRPTSYGDLGSLEARAVERREPGPEEVEIEVHALGLNFKDALYALGQLREYSGFERASDQPLGLECAGVVVRAGTAVQDLEPGDRVAALAAGVFQSHATLHRRLVLRVPDAIPLTDASGTLVAAMTIERAFRDLAELRGGDRVLIHGAAGGVGLAAVAFAQRVGAEVFATASPHKWPLLRELGVEHLYPSRELGYADAIRSATDGRGVEVVLDSPAGPHVPESLAALAEGGRFVEIGKLETWTTEQVAAERPDVRYAQFDLEELNLREPALVDALLARVEREWSADRLALAHRTLFPYAHAGRALRLLAASRHVGKLVVELPAGAAARSSIRSDACYLVTGGLGALGGHTATWLAEQGARELVLLGRRPDSERALALRETLEAAGASVRIEAVDVTDGAALDALFEDIGPRLAGVFHSAGVLHDGVAVGQPAEEVERVLAPKIRGAWNLHERTRDLALDHFVLFSSMASMLGNPGQSAYSAANAFLDGLAAKRRAAGLAGLSIAWGPWSGDGMAARMDERAAAALSARGMGSISPELGVRSLRSLLERPRATPVVGVLPITWNRYLAQLPQVPRFLERLGVEANPQAARDDTLARLRATIATGADTEALRAAIEGWVVEQLARVLGHASADSIDPQRPFAELGIDSLMGVELRHRFEAGLNIGLPVSMVLDYPNAAALAAFMAEQVESAGPDDDLAQLLGEIEQMSDAEAEARLSSEG